MQTIDESQDVERIYSAEVLILERVKDVARRINDRVTDALKDTEECKPLAAAIDEQELLQRRSPRTACRLGNPNSASNTKALLLRKHVVNEHG